MRLIKLSDIGEIVSGSTPKTAVREYWNGSISWATPKDISSLKTPYLDLTEKTITEKGYNSCSTHILPKGSILFTSRAPIGLVGIANIELCTNQGFKSVILKEGYYPLYVYYALKYSTNRLKYLGSGTTFKELSKATFENFEIPVPNLKDQIRIATILSKADNLILEREESMQLLEEFAKNQFLKLFGDPFINNKKLKTEMLGSVCNVTKLAGFEYTKYIKYKPKGEIVAVRGLNVKKGKIKLDNAKYIDKKTSNFLRRSKLFKNDIVMTYIGVNIGDVALIDENDKYHLAPNVAKISVKNRNDLNPIYLLHALMINKTLFFRRTTNTAKQAVNMNSIRKTEILVPPLKSQIVFSKIILKIEKLREKYEMALPEHEKMYYSLLERVFNLRRPLNLAKVAIDIRSVRKTPGLSKQYAKLEKIKKPQVKAKASAIIKQKDSQKKDRKSRGKLTWENVSVEQIANWIKEEYHGFHFSSEMMMRFLKDNHLATTVYHSSEDLKKNAQLNESDDIKTFIFSAINNLNPFIKMEQFFYDAEKITRDLKIKDSDLKLFEINSTEERSGIYFNIIE